MPPKASALATGRGSARASQYMNRNMPPVLKKWLVHVARTGADASAGGEAGDEAGWSGHRQGRRARPCRQYSERSSRAPAAANAQNAYEKPTPP